ncbi:MAG: hypothetical protein WDN24_00790 [Sphingomonas sp.]
MQPDHFAAQRRRLREQRRVGGQRHAQPRPDQILTKALDIGRMRQQRRDISEDVDRIDRRAMRLG